MRPRRTEAHCIAFRASSTRRRHHWRHRDISPRGSLCYAVQEPILGIQQSLTLHVGVETLDFLLFSSVATVKSMKTSRRGV